MYLSQLEIVGFKSFALKTNLRFHDGMTAIVGPNGCGKSNVVDAIRWVLGEQKTSTLRSDKMENVIFNGTKNRKPLGLAEVSMTIENTKGILPTEYAEITITRRLFRSGESQYLLNKTPCRLRDIVDLFMDTGMGPNAYSVIELKMIETILSDRTEERRKLFEEAAGVTKYKTRRREAERRLATVQSDLTRIHDILAEVQKSVRSLSRQADRAKKYREIADELNAIERKIIEYEFAALTGQIRPLGQQLEELRATRERLDRELIEQESVVSEMEEQQAEIADRLGAAESRRNAVNQRLSETSQRLAVSNERVVALKRAQDRMAAESAELADVLVQYEQAVVDAQARQEVLSERIAEAEKDFAAKKAVQDSSLQALQEVRAEAREAKDTVMAKLNAINSLQAKTERNIARIESLRRRIDETLKQAEQAEQRLAVLSGELETEAARRADFDTRIGNAEQAQHEAQERHNRLRREADDLKEGIGERQALIGRKKASLDFLNSLVDTNESSAFLLNSDAWQTEGKRVLLAEAINTDERFRAAIESALGAATGYFVVETVNDALAARQALRQHEKGKATFIALERVPAAEAPTALPVRDGVYGRASELVRADDRLVHAMRGLLGTMAIVGSIEIGWELIQSGLADGAVSLDGEIVSRSGVIRGGGRKLTEGASIGKREQIETLKEEIAVLEEEIDELRRAMKAKLDEHHSINLRDFANTIRQAEADKSRHEQRIAQITYQRDSVKNAIAGYHTSVEGFHKEIAAIENEADSALQGNMDTLQRERREAEERLLVVEKNVRTVEQRLDEESSARHQAEMRLVQLRGEEKNIVADRQRLAAQIDSTRQRRENRIREAEQSVAEIERLEEMLEHLEDELQGLREEADRSLADRNTVAEEQTLLRKRVQQQAELLRTRRREYEESVQRLHETDLRISELRTRRDHLQSRAMSEFEMELVVPPDDAELVVDEEFHLANAREHARSLKSKLQSYGAVNLLAFEEFEKESERQEFLQSQLNDLLESEATLRQTINEINEAAQTKFNETFQQIRTNFIRIFKSLFLEGDEADLLLAEGDPLEADIEIIAKPRGKRPHSIDMLSGGEKTLTAIALLFAIYLVKPSPFCILDEVDAPLDDANIGRFVNLLREFSQDTQFIVITHNKRTMEAADTMYGVTNMEEEGVSRIVSVQMSGRQKPERSAPVRQTVEETGAEPEVQE